MKSKTLILMMVAIACGLAAAYMTSQLLGPKASNDDEQVQYLVAARKLEMGKLITEPEKDFTIKEVPKGKEPKFALVKFEDLKNHRLNKSVGLDQHVTADDLLDKEKDLFTGNLAKGMRAFTIKVNIDTAGGGFVLPQSRVDIMAVTLENGVAYAKTLWQNVLVLAVDTNERRPDDKNSIVASTVTVEVTQKQAEQMATVLGLSGMLRLTLRPWGDEEKVSATGESSKSLALRAASRPEDEVQSEDDGGHAHRLAVMPKVPDAPAPTTPTTPAPVQTVKEEPKGPPPFVQTIFNSALATKVVYSEDASMMEVQKSQPDGMPKPKLGDANGSKTADATNGKTGDATKPGDGGK
jgi:pilus assembly protein CpaB